ncbi:MAG TPA: aldo/keto reductase, partial [Candidatus Competibacter sp.]|nr:aldo/keto reductase [Candidatus Competibacter sp.]
MDYRFLGASGFKVPVLTLGTGTFGGRGELFKAWGSTDVAEAKRLVDLCLEAGLNMFDSADIYSDGAAEEILGAAIQGRRDQVLISTKATFRSGSGANEVGSSRHHLIRSVDSALRRLGTDYIDLFQLHGFDAATPVEETLRTLDDLVTAGKLRYVGCSNFSGWHLMKSLAVAERYGWTRYVAHQAYYSLVGREYEWELMPLALDQGVGCVVWSPLGWGRLTGRIRRGQPLPTASRLQSSVATSAGPQVSEEYLFKVVDALDEVAAKTGKTIPQIALNWLLQRPSIATVIIGARDERQLRDNLGAVGWSLTAEQVAKLDQASAVPRIYPYWHQAGFSER